MRVYRACRARFRAFTGDGASRYGGRWNSPGRPVVYTALSRSLAILESLVHLHEAPDDYVIVPATIPEGVAVKRVAWEELDPSWAKPEHAGKCRALGDTWVAGAETAVLVVPSIVVPAEANVLLNPRHRDFGQVVVEEPEPFLFDPRLF